MICYEFPYNLRASMMSSIMKRREFTFIGGVGVRAFFQ